jgi:hypothetical protein
MNHNDIHCKTHDYGFQDFLLLKVVTACFISLVSGLYIARVWPLKIKKQRHSLARTSAELEDGEKKSPSNNIEGGKGVKNSIHYIESVLENGYQYVSEKAKTLLLSILSSQEELDHSTHAWLLKPSVSSAQVWTCISKGGGDGILLKTSLLVKKRFIYVYIYIHMYIYNINVYIYIYIYIYMN